MWGACCVQLREPAHEDMPRHDKGSVPHVPVCCPVADMAGQQIEDEKQLDDSPANF